MNAFFILQMDWWMNFGADDILVFANDANKIGISCMNDMVGLWLTTWSSTVLFDVNVEDKKLVKFTTITNGCTTKSANCGSKGYDIPNGTMLDAFQQSGGKPMKGEEKQ